MQKLFLTFIIVFLTVTQIGCKQLATPINFDDPNARNLYLHNLRCWEANGRVSIQNNQDTVTASFVWLQENEQYNLHFYSALSSESVTIYGNQQGITNIVNNGETAQDLSLEQNLPLAQLVFWLKGLPAIGSKPRKATYNNKQQLLNLEQDGWHIEYQEYRTYDAISLPRKIILQNHNTKAKLFIKQWQL